MRRFAGERFFEKPAYALDRATHVFERPRFRLWTSVAKPDSAIGIDEKFLYDANVASQTLRTESHRQAVDVCFQMPTVQAQCTRLVRRCLIVPPA